MYLTKFDDFYKELKKVSSQNYDDFFMVSKAEPFETLLIQKLTREVNGKEEIFFGVRDFKLKKEFQGKGIFTNMLMILEANQVPILVDDIINPKLENWLFKRGYQSLITQKYDQKLIHDLKRNIEMYKIYADGACQPNPGESGSGIIVYKDNRVVRLFYGNYKEYATNNIAELEALLQAVKLAIKCFNVGEKEVEILTDSQYSIKSITEWIGGWLKNNWKNGTVKNKEIIEEIYKLYLPYNKRIVLSHVRGHVGIEGNELADRMALHALHTKQVDYKDFGAENSIEFILAMYQK